MVEHVTGRVAGRAAVPVEYALEHARKVAAIVGPSSAAAAALAELGQRTASGEDAVVVRRSWSWLVVPRLEAEAADRDNDTNFFQDETRRLLATAYLEAYAVANEGKKTPGLSYSGGWWRLVTYDSNGYPYDTKCRGSELEAMTKRLVAKCAVEPDISVPSP